MINLELVKENAKKLKKDGLEDKVLARAKEILEDSKKIAIDTFSNILSQEEIDSKIERIKYTRENGSWTAGMSDEDFNKNLLETKTTMERISKDEREKAQNNYESHVFPETIAIYTTLLGENLDGLNFLDLGSGVSTYLPLLSITMKNLGANVLAVDMVNGKEKFEKLGIDYLETDLSGFRYGLMQDVMEKKYSAIFKDKDIIAARSFLGGGFSSGNYWERLEEDIEYKTYKRMIDFVKKNNGKPALYELDDPVYLNFKGEVKDQFEKDFGEILYGYDGNSKPFIIK